MITLADFTGADGKIDWPAYRAASALQHQADVAAGKWCSECNRYLLWPKGVRDQCLACKRLKEPAECDHHKMVRCPKCGLAFDPSEQDYYSLYSDGEHQVTCGECSHQFEITTRTSYTFTSPARITQPTAELGDGRNEA